MSGRSRYKDSKYFAETPGRPDTFPGIRPRDIGAASGIVEYQLKEWDRLDMLSFNYYNNADLWWRIMDANPEVLCAVDLFINPETGENDERENSMKTILIPGSGE